MCSLFIPILEFNIQSYLLFSSSYPISRLAAVLIILYEQDGLIRVVLTTRSKELRTHAGQTALPGGKKDPIDVDSTATAVRSDKTNSDGYPLTL